MEINIKYYYIAFIMNIHYCAFGRRRDCGVIHERSWKQELDWKRIWVSPVNFIFMASAHHVHLACREF